MYSVFRNLAIIILSAKFFGLVARKCKAPQVVGEILAGLIIGPCVLNLVQTSDAISTFAEIGVVMLMFTTGLGTNLKELIKAGPIATLVACVGVAVPLVGGTLLYSAFYGFSAVGSPEFYRALFIGTIMTATSVSITVATLQELGHLKSFLGTTIVSAAVIDDVIGIVVLTCVLGASSGTGTGLGKVLINTVLFFATAVGVGVVAHFAMTWLDKRNPHTQRITIVSMAFCFAMAYIAEEYFGIADITGVSVNPYTAYDGSLMNELIISFENKFSVPKSVSFHDNDIYLTIGTTKSYVRAEIFEGEMRHFYSDYKNYYYLPKEDMAIHKSVAAYVDHEYREKCKAYNCYVRKTGTFIRQYSDFMKPEFRFDIKDKYSYFLLTDDFINSKQMVLSYVKHITDHLFNL